MKIFSWIRNKLNANDVANKPHHTMHQSCKEEFSDWPNGLLAIGTFGSTNLKQCNQDNLVHTTPEEDFDKELRQLLDHHISLGSGEKSVQELLDCLEKYDKDTRRQRTTSVVHGGRKDIRSDNKKRSIGKKSLSFLIKKALLCRGGPVPAPVLKDPLPDPRLDHSRMEKILRAMLHKKIYPTSKTSTPKKYLDMPEIDSDEEEESRESKWVKTDSEYIVLEI